MTNYVVVTSLRRDERRVEVFVTPLSLTGGSGNLSIFTIKLVYFIFDLPWPPGIHKCLKYTKEEIRKYLKNR
jgi:hypothetical protein